jgi:hypothetical protein
MSTSLGGNDRYQIDKLSSENWHTWKFQMKHILLGKDLWKYVDGSETLAVGADNAAKVLFKNNIQKALTVIVLSVTTAQLYLITGAAWKSLCDHYESKSLGNKLILKKTVF